MIDGPAGDTPMEPTELTCPGCGTSWKVIKAGDGPITCPNCKAVVGAAPPPPTPARPAAPPAPAAPPPPVPRPRPATDLSDVDDPGIGAPVRSRIPDVPVERRGRHPLATVAIVLLIVMLVPVALFACLWAVCAAAF